MLPICPKGDLCQRARSGISTYLERLALSVLPTGLKMIFIYLYVLQTRWEKDSFMHIHTIYIYTFVIAIYICVYIYVLTKNTWAQTCHRPGVNHWTLLIRTGHVLSLASAQPEAASEVVFISTASSPGRQTPRAWFTSSRFRGPRASAASLRSNGLRAFGCGAAAVTAVLWRRAHTLVVRSWRANVAWSAYNAGRSWRAFVAWSAYRAGRSWRAMATTKKQTPRHEARLAAWLELQRPGLQCFVAHAQLRQRQTRGYLVPEKSHLARAPRTSHILYI